MKLRRTNESCKTCMLLEVVQKAPHISATCLCMHPDYTHEDAARDASLGFERNRVWDPAHTICDCHEPK